ncbi:ArnT family glycosyltransferase [Nocardia sp. NPDC020380]|uniref:ArnT family glycosyltransferase n=1 Tax=Nocardia sp. NPDC020380 TaxID=3364309 RepID=UPI0037AB37A9
MTQPTRARLALFGIAALAGVLYAWGIASQVPHLYYSAAVRSMSMSWHNAFFAAFDPDATISIDKLPGAFWVQALSVRIFGPHVWAFILPQVIEGVLTVLVLYRAVRRLSGPGAGLIAAAVAAVAPATVALNRGNISDTLLVLLLVLAADQAAAVIQTGRNRHLLYSGLWIGLAFQAKMVQAWFIVPAVAAAVLLATPRNLLRQRIIGTLGFGAITAAVSLSWMTIVSLLPAGHRPYVDGSRDNSLFAQVFVYNAASRTNNGFSVGAANFATGSSGPGYRTSLVLGPDNHFDHLLGGGGGREAGWLVPLALLCLAARAWTARRRPRTDPCTAALTLWGGWLIIHMVVFLAIGTVNPYYLAVLTPAIAALIGMGAMAFRNSTDRRVRLGGTIAVAATAVYGWWLLTPAPGWVRITAVVLTVVAGLLAVLSRGLPALAPLLATALIAPAAAALSLVADGYGPLDMPFESAQTRQVTQVFMREALTSAGQLHAQLAKMPSHPRYPLVTYTSVLAGPFILDNGQQVPSIGGFTGMAPVPTTADIARLIESGQVGIVLATPADDERLTWIQQHCRKLPNDDSSISVYDCSRR